MKQCNALSFNIRERSERPAKHHHAICIESEGYRFFSLKNEKYIYMYVFSMKKMYSVEFKCP